MASERESRPDWSRRSLVGGLLGLAATATTGALTGWMMSDRRVPAAVSHPTVPKDGPKDGPTLGPPLAYRETTPGSLRWSVAMRPSTTAVGTAVSGGRLYTTVDIGNANHDSFALAVDASTGILQWQAPLNAGIAYGTPAVTGSLLACLTSSTKLASNTVSTTFALSALDSRNGTRKWAFALPNGRYSDPVIADTNVYISDGLTTLFALDAATGRPRWQFKSTYYGPYPDCSPATVLDDTVYICAAGAAWALDPATGAQRWSTPIPGGTYGAPVIAVGENVYVTASTKRPKDPGLYVLEAATGAQRWTVPTVSHPVVVGDNVYIATGSGPFATNGGLDALDAATGTQHWTTSNRSLIPIYGNGDTLVCIQLANLPQTMSGLCAIEARTGSMRWQSRFWPAGPVGIAGGIAYFVESANGLYALNL